MLPSGYEDRVSEAVRHYWSTLRRQASQVGEGDRGGRAAVTGGRQMDGFAALVTWLLRECGLPPESIYDRQRRELPGFFRPTKEWDVLVVHRQQLLAAVEFKSQKGPSFGNNYNNRTEEALGSATDLWTAYREGAFGKGAVRPWLGWLMLVEDADGSRRPVGVSESHFSVFPEFAERPSYAKRYELLLSKLRRERMYDGTALLLSRMDSSEENIYSEPSDELSIRRFLAALAGHVRGFLDGEQ